MSIFKDCDIRGIYGRELTQGDVYAVGRALASYAPGKICVGGDVRTSTPELKAALIEGLLASGAQITDLGVIPTPALYFALAHGDFVAGATVTASHNPPEYNGVKFMIGKTPVTRAVIDEIAALVAGGNFRAGKGTIEKWDVSSDYSAALTKRFRARRPLHVLIDAGSGAMSAIAPAVFRAVGYRVTELYCQANGRFPHRSPNPSDYSCLGPTGAAVRTCGADFGVAFDGDGDRAVFLDETGAPVQNEKSLVLLIRRLLKDRPTPVVYDQKSSSIVRDAIVAMGGTPLPEKSGHAFIKKRFLENGAALAGEVSGHFFFGELGYDDGLFAALTMAELLCDADATLGALAQAIVCPPITPDIRLHCTYAEQDEWLRRAELAAKDAGAQISRLDGVRADFADGWFLLRKSVTAEQVTLRAEAGNETRLNEILQLLAKALPAEAQAALEAFLRSNA